MSSDERRETRAMKKRFRFEKLEVWQEARAFNAAVYRLSRAWPRDEVFALTSQVRRAATSVAANIAEGAGRNSDADFGRFLEQAYGSLMETVSHLYLALDQSYVDEAALDELLASVDRLAARIVALNQSLSVAHTKTPFARKRAFAPSSLDPRPSTPSAHEG
jgi:four helix bundle protein